MVYECAVQVPSGRYSVAIGHDLLAASGEKLRAFGFSRKAALIVDAAIAQSHGLRVVGFLQAGGLAPVIYEVPSGESSKSMEQAARILSFLAQHRLERRSPVIALGGGVVGDLAGFVAATYLRGVPFVQVPTTLLAMVDSSVGGKTGVNLPEGKNLAGCFYQPQWVVADLDFLQTLPAREFAAGMAEVIKYGIIADETLFRRVAGGKIDDLGAVIHRCVEIKAQIVSDDEKETSGRRALLNFGHTLGHAIEQAAGYGKLVHGEAVAIGMHAAAHLSRQKLGLDPSSVTAIENAIRANHLPLTIPGLDRNALRAAMGRDKKVVADKNRWVLAPRLGQAVVCEDVSPDEVESAIAKVVVDPVGGS